MKLFCNWYAFIMNMIIENDSVCFGISIPLSQMSELAKKHLDTIRGTQDIEIIATDLIREGFQDGKVKTFIKSVCSWGNYIGLAGRILNNNSTEKIRQALTNAMERLAMTPPDLAGALTSINRIHGLGKPSFASKHLRFLNPKFCPVYDSILNNSLPYSFNPEGYAKFGVDCSVLAIKLTELHINNPFPQRANAWYVSDVEAAIYIYLKDVV